MMSEWAVSDCTLTRVNRVRISKFLPVDFELINGGKSESRCSPVCLLALILFVSSEKTSGHFHGNSGLTAEDDVINISVYERAACCSDEPPENDESAFQIYSEFRFIIDYWLISGTPSPDLVQFKCFKNVSDLKCEGQIQLITDRFLLTAVHLGHVSWWRCNTSPVPWMAVLFTSIIITVCKDLSLSLSHDALLLNWNKTRHKQSFLP